MHGGRLAAAAAAYPHAEKPWLDLSTGINPNPYPIGELPSSCWQRLPDPEAIAALEAEARAAYHAPNEASVIAVPGSDTALSALPRLLAPARRVAILGPTYSGHARAWTASGHDVTTVTHPDELAPGDVAILVNPNNPDGRVIPTEQLLALATTMQHRDGLLIVDEAFADATPHLSLAPLLDRAPALLILRSFGKFYGLAGLRLGFIVTRHPLATGLRAHIGDWPVSGPAVDIGRRALRDVAWGTSTRTALAESADRLDATLRPHVRVLGGTNLFRYVSHPRAAELFCHLAARGILVRPFAEQTDRLRVGLPASPQDFARLATALAQFT